MRGISTCLAMLGLAVLSLTATAVAAPTFTFKTKALPIPGFPGTGDILGAGAAIQFEGTISGTEYGGFPPPLIGVKYYAPAGAKLHPQGFATCAPSTIEKEGPGPCPKTSIAGPKGSAGGVVSFGSERVHETVSVQPFFAPGGNLEFFVDGTTPVSLEILATGHVVGSSPPFGLEVVGEVPLIETVPGALDASAEQWEVPYLPVDPKDLGRTYEAIIRVNSQSGKGGVAYLLDTNYGYDLPRNVQIEFSRIVQAKVEATGGELSSAEIWQIFQTEYLETTGPFRLVDHHVSDDVGGGTCTISGHLAAGDELRAFDGSGNGPIDAFVHALRDLEFELEVHGYHEHAIGDGADASAVAYIEATVGRRDLVGIGRHANIVTASLYAIVNALNRADTAEASPSSAASAAAQSQETRETLVIR